MPSTPYSLKVVLSAILLAGCASVSTGTEDAGTLAEEALPEVVAEWKEIEERVVGEPVGWIGAFEDPVLEKLVAEAQENNKNLEAAAAAVESSRALAGIADAQLSPDVSAGLTTENSGILDGGDSSDVGLGLEASWEVDLWGRLRSGREGAVRDLEAVEADYVFSQYSLAASVAEAYFLAIEAHQQLGVTEANVEALTETDRIVRVRLENGMGDAEDAALSLSDLSAARDSLIELEGSKRDALRALELLLGRYPSADIELRGDLPAVPPAPPAGIPSDLLERRPDLIAAERRIASAVTGVDEAKAAKLPSLSLTGSIGGSSNDLSNILDPSNVAWSAASSLLAPIFDGGERDRQVDLADAELQAAVAEYADAALDAFSDVETALDQSVVLRRREEQLQVSSDQADEALRLVNLRYSEGETDLIDVLDIQTRALSAKSDLISVQRGQLSEYVALNLALGGSWE
ncbi:MAG: efflux transporter outer membrane subunit [Pseudomonadota bacterium]